MIFDGGGRGRGLGGGGGTTNVTSDMIDCEGLKFGDSGNTFRTIVDQTKTIRKRSTRGAARRRRPR